VGAVRTRRIWHAETAAIEAALEAVGARRTAERVRTAQREALVRRPAGSAFVFQPAPEEAGPLAAALAELRRRSRNGSEP
jgi:sarcosine oxidase gamma subunit